MRLWHLLFGVFLTALLLVIIRDPAGRVGVVVFFTGLGEVVFGVFALLALFQTVGAIGQSDSLASYLQALTATILVLAIASFVMNGLLWVGCWLIQQSLV
jgi:hypothetical protein